MLMERYGKLAQLADFPDLSYKNYYTYVLGQNEAGLRETFLNASTSSSISASLTSRVFQADYFKT